MQDREGWLKKERDRKNPHYIPHAELPERLLKNVRKRKQEAKRKERAEAKRRQIANGAAEEGEHAEDDASICNVLRSACNSTTSSGKMLVKLPSVSRTVSGKNRQIQTFKAKKTKT